jgi:signal peptide peptidase SppA
MRIWNRITGEPWAITEGALQTILEIAARENESPEAVAAKLGRELRNTHTVTERDGVAIIPVVGPLFRYANLFTQVSGATSYEILSQDLATALEDPAIRAIVLDIDSPGGEVNGVSELAGMITEARGKKPIVAYASGDAASGAYWIASAADQIVVSETSALGSIGVVGLFRRKDSKDAASVVEIVSSQSPNKRPDPGTEEGRARLQARIDAMAQVFITTVAHNRNLSPASVVENFGAGDVMIGASAVAVGMADRIGSLERLIAELATPSPPKVEGFFISQTKEITMDKETLTRDHPDLAAQLRQEGITAERARIQGILGSEAAVGREQLAKELALTTDINAPEACLLLEHAPQAQTQPASSFDRVMATIPNPAIIPASGNEGGDEVEATAKRLAGY